MQKPNFPNVIFRVTLWPGKDDAPVGQFARVPAKFNQKTVTTSTSRRIAMVKLGKIEEMFSSDQTIGYRAWVQDESEIPAVLEVMHQKMVSVVQKRLESLQTLQLKLRAKHTITEVKLDD